MTDKNFDAVDDSVDGGVDSSVDDTAGGTAGGSASTDTVNPDTVSTETDGFDNFPRRDPHKLRTVASFILGGAATLTLGAVGYGIATNPDLQSASGLASILAERSEVKDEANDESVITTVTKTTTVTLKPSEDVAAVDPSEAESTTPSVEPDSNTTSVPGDPRHEGHIGTGMSDLGYTDNSVMGYTPGAVHQISAGETLSIISSRYGVSVDQLVAANGIVDPNLIYSGSALVLP